MATAADIPAIIHIAEVTWPHTYQGIITEEQIRFMLNRFYNEALMAEQLGQRDHHFLVAEESGKIYGYTHTIRDAEKPGIFKLSKIYILPDAQGQNLGRKLLDATVAHVLPLGATVLELNVNRSNPAKFFYDKQGFEVVDEVDIPLDKFWLNDYIMHKKLAF
jgi:ribosomal protein S18 acetylase RimI-like enzyme